jgi:[ribosomal protein S18]-alanine N-acetyltransferase
MTTADLDSVLKLELALFGEEAWSRQMLTGELDQQPVSRCYLVAEDDEGIAGYGGVLVAGEQADILTIAVATTRWGQGIGSSVLEALMTEAARRECIEVFLEVRADNSRAQRLYQWWGFAEIGIRRGYYQPSGTDAIVMRRSLASVVRPGPPPTDGRGGAADGWAAADGLVAEDAVAGDGEAS